ncbi:uncharacterized protein [Dermacentor albipictus]|uniref:uncharacterized protein isoform X2 n=1 Tax=Dermacentor albipictus TaxID=60249 RepID=UPI0038FC37D7
MCTLTAPNQYEGPYYRSLTSQIVPNNTICDYIILNIKQSPDGSYNDTSYMFLRAHTNRYLFTLDNSVTFREMKDKLLEQPFMTSVNMIREILDLHGFGIFTLDTYTALTYTATDIDFLNLIFQHLNQMLNKLGGLTPFNFFAFKLRHPKRAFAEYVEFLQKINGITSIVIILTTTDVKSLQVQPSTARDTHCLYHFTEPTLECWRAVYKHDPTGYSFKYLLKGCCNFANYSGLGLAGVATFETSRSIQDKMTSSKRFLQNLSIVSTHVVGWLAHDVTFNLAPEQCGGEANRLLKMRELVT